MNGSESTNCSLSDENVALGKLLSSWNLDCLLQHFIDERVNVDVLLMLKPHHIPMLLSSFRLGVQVRFEHHLEKWRHHIDKPLPPRSSSNHAPCTCSRYTPKGLQKQLPPSTQNASTQCSIQFHVQHEPMTARPSVSPLSSPPSQDSPEAAQPPKLTAAAAADSKPSNSNNYVIVRRLPTMTAAEQVAALTAATKHRSVKNPVFSGDDYRTPHVSVSLILNASQPKGQQLLDYFRQHQCLTNAHRLQLINLIATYFDDHDFHLSLQTSYNMEREILQLFPGEVLESYRTEKRGKIYVKFCNMKRYKALREKPPKLRCYGSSSSRVGDGVAPAEADMVDAPDDDFSMSGFDTWEPPSATSDVYIKTENITEDFI